MSRRRMRTQKEWKVEMSGLASEEWPSRRSTRSAISLAALLVKVTARMESGRDALFADEPGDAAGDDAGFARAGSGQDEQGALGGLDGGALFGIQIVEERLQGASPGGKDPGSSVPFRGLREQCVVQQCVSSAPADY